MTEHKQVNREDDLKFCLFIHMMSRKAFKIRGIDDFERALDAIAYNSGKEDDTSDESSDSDTDSHYSGDADDVDLDVYPGSAVPVDDFNGSESDQDDANEAPGK